MSRAAHFSKPPAVHPSWRLPSDLNGSAATRRAAALAAPASGAPFAPNAFLRIGADNSVTVIAKHLEMGQGAYTGIATIVAEELDADWAQVRVESAPADAKRYANLAFGTIQGTGGSSAMANSWKQLREAGAKARAMLLAAAASDWHVPVAELTVSKGVVSHAATKRPANFGSLVKTAATLPVPDQVTLKDPKDFKLIGHKAARVDAAAKSDGTAQFTLDVVLPGMLVALLKRPPQFGATVKSFDATAASAVPGVVKVVQVPRGVAVVAKSFWAAKQGRDALQIDWDDSKAEKRSSADLMEEYRRLADQPAPAARKEGDAERALGERDPKSDCQLRISVSRACADGAARCGGQAQRQQLRDLGRRSIPNRRSNQRCAAPRVWIRSKSVFTRCMPAAALAGAPIPGRTTLWKPYRLPRRTAPTARRSSCSGPARMISMAACYRPMYFHKLEAGLNAQGKLTAWRHVIVGQSIMADTLFAAMIKDGIDATSVEGAANIAYAIPNIAVNLATTKTGVPVLWWRVVGSSHTTFAVEAFIDEVAHAAGEDGYRIPAETARSPSAIERRCSNSPPRRRAGAAAPLPAGRGRGIAVAEAFKTYVAQVAEVSVDKDGHVNSRSRGMCRRLRHGDQPRHHCRANGRRHRLWAGSRALWCDHVEGRPYRAGQLQQLSRVAHERDAQGRSAHRAID